MSYECHTGAGVGNVSDTLTPQEGEHVWFSVANVNLSLKIRLPRMNSIVTSSSDVLLQSSN